MKDQAPVIKNKDYRMTIDNLGSNGEGVGRIDNFAVFVEGALPGETVDVKIIKVTKSYAVGKLLTIVEKSPERIEPLCPYYKRCGGCHLQHLDYNAQLAYKTRLVEDNLRRIGGLSNVHIHDTIGMEHPWQYRNKAQFPVGLYKEQLAIGFFAKRSHDIVNMESCLIQHAFNDQVIRIVREYIHTYNIPVYDEQSHSGLIRHILIKIAFHSNQIMVVLVVNGRNLSHPDKLVGKLRSSIPGLQSIVLNINTAKTNVILGQENVVIWGKDHITDRIGNLNFRISPLSFFQVNPVQTEKLYGKALEYAALTGDEIVFDAYCGIGTISLFLAQKARKVYGVEVVEQAVIDAKENARINNISNVEFLAGESEKVIPDLIRQGVSPDVVVVDPPRKGCDEELLKAIAEAQPRRIVYVSCNPSTLARDLRILEGLGYAAKEVQPVDMFPHTSHVETVVLITRVDNQP